MMKRIAIGVVAVVLLFVGIAAWQLGLFTAEPAEVTLEETVAAVSATTEAPATNGTSPATSEAITATTASPEAPVIAGAWVVAQQEATFVGYRAEGLTGTSVGRSPAVSGTLTATTDEITEVDITADLTQLESDSSLRDDHLRTDGLETDTFATSVFRLTQPISIPAEPAFNEELSFAAVGDLTLKAITLPVAVQLDATLTETALVVVGSSDLNLDDFGATIGDTNEGTLEFSLVFAR